MSDNKQEKFMQRALVEADRASGRTRPNPLVGCVIVKNDKIIATGYHKKAGQAHAEVLALQKAGIQAQGADVFVNLEPCAHHGRTGPCCETLIEAGVRRVIVGMRDPNPAVNGKGIRRLRKAGIEVESGVLLKQCKQLNCAYIHYINIRRPWIVVKFGQSLDGKVATRTGDSKWITGPQARKHGHQLRNRLDAILVGRKTVIADDPSLTCRIRNGRDPVRIVLDSQAHLRPRYRVFQLASTSKSPTWWVMGQGAQSPYLKKMLALGVKIIRCRTKQGRILLSDLMQKCYERELLSVLVEGGPTIAGSFFDAALVDQVYAFISPQVIGGIDAFSSVGARGVAKLKDTARLNDYQITQIGTDLMITGNITRS